MTQMPPRPPGSIHGPDLIVESTDCRRVFAQTEIWARVRNIGDAPADIFEVNITGTYTYPDPQRGPQTETIQQSPRGITQAVLNPQTATDVQVGIATPLALPVNITGTIIADPPITNLPRGRVAEVNEANNTMTFTCAF